MFPDTLRESLARHVGRTVTIFTESGGLSGSGFTGTLACIGECTVKLITDIGAAPTCPVGSDCTCGMPGNVGYGVGYGGYGGYGYGGGCGGGYGGGYGFGNSATGPNYNWLGSIAEIPIDRIVNFTHNAI